MKLAKKHLSKDKVLAKVIKKVPLVAMKPRKNYFMSLVTAIVNQQLSGKAAKTILDRFVRLFKKNHFPTPREVLKMSDNKLRSAGLSFSKVSYIKNLSEAVDSNQLDFKKIKKMGDEEVIETLITIKGIGRWTAEMFLMFTLSRPDVFSHGDLGLRNAIAKLYNIKGKRAKTKIEKLALKWSPHRTLASRYLWASLDLE